MGETTNNNNKSTRVSCLFVDYSRSCRWKSRPLNSYRFSPKTDTSGSKRCFYFSEKTPNSTIAAITFLLSDQYTFAFFFYTKLYVNCANQIQEFLCHSTFRSLQFDRILSSSTASAKVSYVNTLIFSLFTDTSTKWIAHAAFLCCRL